MSFFRMIQRDLVFYWRSHIPAMMLAGMCCAVLTGAMLVGDSVQYSLRRLNQMRLGKVRFALAAGDRFFRQELAEELRSKTNSLLIVPVLAFRGILESPDGSTRINNLNIYGIDFKQFGQLLGPPGARANLEPIEGIYVSESIASRLNGIRGEFLLRMQLPSQLSNDLIFSTETGNSQAWPIEIAGTLFDEDMGRFSLQARQEAPLNVFVPIGWLAQKTHVTGKANMLLCGADGKNYTRVEDVSAALKALLEPEDLELELRRNSEPNVFELCSPRIFLDAPIADAALNTGSGAAGVLTYFVNDIRLGDKRTPYSTVSAIGGQPDFDALGDNGIVINEWLADDLGADVGDTLTLTYFKLAATRQLTEESARFIVRRVAPMRGLYADPALMPDFPGLGEAENCRDWDPGIPIDLDRIRPKDEAYWDTYKGAPKAFISLAAAQKIWSNRFGTLTAVRWPAGANNHAAVRADLMAKIEPAQVGFVFEDVQAAARAGAAGSTDFSGLFAGLSMFLIFSAAILLALVFVFHTEARLAQIGILLATGWGRFRIFALFLAEGAGLSLLGCAAGAVVSLLYTNILIAVLNATFWAKALASLHLVFHASFSTLVKGVAVSFLICAFSIQAALFYRIRRPVHQLLTGTLETYRAGGRRRVKMYGIPGCVLIVAGGLLPWSSEWPQAGLFFISGTLVLAGFFLAAAAGLGWLRLASRSFARSQPLLAVRNIPRRTSRSLAVLMTLGCGVFLVVSVGTNYKQIGADAQKRRSGTGGFTLLAETTLPMTRLPSLPQDTEDRVPGILPEAVVGLRVYQQEEANCLNLNRALRPTLLGVLPEALAHRDAFDFQETLDGKASDGWRLLSAVQEDGAIPAIGDYPTVFWALGKRVGDRFAYRDESGRVIQLKIVGMLKDSILQGRLLISEENFVRLFPSVDGMEMFLMDADWDTQEAQARLLSRLYRDAGMDVIPASRKLARFHEVENTYMAIFLMLGGLGLILGSAGLGLTLTLNVLDRRAELAMMQAVGFSRRDLGSMLFMEHAVLLAAGLVCGLIPAVLAVVPALTTQGQMFPGGRIVLIMTAMLLSGIFWIRIAVAYTLKTRFLDVLKNE